MADRPAWPDELALRTSAPKLPMVTRSMGIAAILKGIASHPLNRGARAQAISRFVRWQLASRVMAAPIALPFVNNTRILVESGMSGATGNWYNGLLEPAEMSFALHALRPGDLFVDVGANVGVYSIMAAGAVGADVVAVEPVPLSFERLEMNIRLNDLRNIEARRVGLSDAPGRLAFTTGRDCMNRVATPEDGGGLVEVEVTTLDRLNGKRVPALVKIDVEGHELAVLNGARKVLASPDLQAVIMETNGSGACFGVTDGQLHEIMEKNGFVARGYDWERRELIEPANAANTIFVRNIAEMTAKCRAAPRFHLVNRSV